MLEPFFHTPRSYHRTCQGSIVAHGDLQRFARYQTKVTTIWTEAGLLCPIRRASEKRSKTNDHR
jgi:hypothetical protein